mmetsp:Transcript_50204/g.108790  ORF Transcript_50204/g.108790 Transcript_50204/m.108790 type:complete len:207 (+) Transcript_50204:172-792(+)|eukprot:4227089-Pleurochrysis_carterae.AAC.3
MIKKHQLPYCRSTVRSVNCPKRWKVKTCIVTSSHVAVAIPLVSRACGLHTCRSDPRDAVDWRACAGSPCSGNECVATSVADGLRAAPKNGQAGKGEVKPWKSHWCADIGNSDCVVVWSQPAALAALRGWPPHDHAEENPLAVSHSSSSESLILDSSTSRWTESGGLVSVCACARVDVDLDRPLLEEEAPELVRDGLCADLRERRLR